MIARERTPNPGMYSWGAVHEKHWSEGYRNTNSKPSSQDIASINSIFLSLSSLFKKFQHNSIP